MMDDYANLIINGIKIGDQIVGPYELEKIFSKSY